jgi:hypothetical protein
LFFDSFCTIIMIIIIAVSSSSSSFCNHRDYYCQKLVTSHLTHTDAHLRAVVANVRCHVTMLPPIRYVGILQRWRNSCCSRPSPNRQDS